MAAKDRKTRTSADLTPRMWLAIRAAYEADAKSTFTSVAREFNVGVDVVKRRAYDEDWQKATADTLAGMSEKAHMLADRAAQHLSGEDTGPEIDAGGDAPQDSEPEQSGEEFSQKVGAEKRAEILHRHRKEWAAPRKLSYEAVNNRDFDRAKLAKITSETLQIIQSGERKAWGLDKASEGDGVTVVIERG